MWRLSDAELNCVNTKMRRISACRQLLIGISTSRYLPPIGTAGFDRVWVSGNNRLPWPPPSTIASTESSTAISAANRTPAAARWGAETDLLQFFGFGLSAGVCPESGHPHRSNEWHSV